MEPPSFSAAGAQLVSAAPGSEASLVLPLPSGSPPFDYEWSRAGGKLDDRFRPSHGAGGVRLTISTVSTGDSGVYTLQASNAAGKDMTRVRLEVCPDEKPTGEDPPTFLRRLQDLTVKVGTRTRFLVEIVSSTECRVTWYRNERRLLEAERIALVRDGNFWCADISAVSVDDAGRWTCTAENVGGRASCSAHLIVLVPKAYKRPEFIEELRALLTEQGTVSLECKVVGVPTPVLRWFKDSREIKAGDVFALTANAEDPTSLGTYTCEAVNCMGRAYSSSKVHVIGRASREGSDRPPSGSLEPPPIFTKELEDQFVRICEPLTLSCNIVVPPWPRSIVWYNKEGKIEPSEKYRVLEDGVGGYLLEVPSAEWPDEGEWKCVATSSGGRVGITTCYVSMDVPKNFRKPRFMENLQAVLTEEGLVSFECKVVGFPTPVLSWFKDGQELKPGDVYQLTGTNSLGSYCCIARNCMGQASSSAELTVEDIQNQLNEEEKLQLFSKNQAPKFLQGLKSVEAKIDEPFRFTVKVAIPPEPTVLWYRDDQPVDESARCHLEKEERGVFFLDIQSLEFMDQAEWKCVAMNDFGHSVTSCFLKLIIPRHYKKPRFLENLQAILSDEGAVNLECKVIGVPQPVLKWYKDGEELKPGDIHRIISGQDGTCCLGTYTCEAQNCMGIAASSASLLGFEDSIKSKGKKKIDEPSLQRNLSLSTIHEERTSQMYDTPVGDMTLDEKGEISFSFDGKEVSVSLYETPDLTEEEAMQIVEMYADQLSENVTEHNVVELPPLRFVKETSTSGNLLMEAIIIDVSPEYFTSPDEDLRTEADVEDISIADENGPPQLSLDQEIDGEDYLEKTMALLSDEKADFPKKTDRKKSDSHKSADDYFSLSRDQSLSEEKNDDETQALTESDLQSFASARSSAKAKSKCSKPSIEDGHESSDITKTVLLKEDLHNLRQHGEINSGIATQQERRSNSESEKSSSKIKEIDEDINLAGTLIANASHYDREKTKTIINTLILTFTKLINGIQVIERDIILKSELMSSAATASRSLEIVNSLILPLSEIHSIAETINQTMNESIEITTSLFTRLPQSLSKLYESLTIIEKCIDLESENKTLVKKTCSNVIEKCGNELVKLVSDISLLVDCQGCPFLDKTCISCIQTTTNEILKTIKCSATAVKENKKVLDNKDKNLDKITPELKHLQKTQKVLYELRNPLNSLLHMSEAVNISSFQSADNDDNITIFLNNMLTPIQALQSALEQIEFLSVTEIQSSLPKYNTEIMETVMASVIKLRSSFEELSLKSRTLENVEILEDVLNVLKRNINEISAHLDAFDEKIGSFDILHSENKLEALQKMAQILINLENSLVTLDILPHFKTCMASFHKCLTKVLENVIESNEAKKYLSFLEICDNVNVLNALIKNINSNDMLSLAAISNNLNIIQEKLKNIEFTQDLNFSIMSTITDLLINIQETINLADTSTYSLISENVDDMSVRQFEEGKLKCVLEHIEKAISTITNVVTLETTRDLDIQQCLNKIIPTLEEIKFSIASYNMDVNEPQENVSHLSISTFTHAVANPLCELNLGISVLNDVICEKVRECSGNDLKVELATPLLELRDALEILQQDVISQYSENANDLDINSSIAHAVQSIQNCMLLIQEQDLLENADELSTLDDISAIKTTADLLSSDLLLSPTVHETNTVVDPRVTVEFGTQFIESVLTKIRNLNNHVLNFQTPEVLGLLNTLATHDEFSNLHSIKAVIDQIHCAIESILQHVTLEESQEKINFFNPTKLSAIIQPVQILHQHISIFDLNVAYESASTMEQAKYFLKYLLELDNCLCDSVDYLHAAMETADVISDISTQIDELQQQCKELKNNLDLAKNHSTVDESPEFIALDNSLCQVLSSCSQDINIVNVKRSLETLQKNAPLAQDDILGFTIEDPLKILHEVTISKSISDIEKSIASLAKLKLVDTEQAPEYEFAKVNCDQLANLEYINKSIDNCIHQLNLDTAHENTLMTAKSVLETFKNEMALLCCLLKQKPTTKRIIKMLQLFHHLNHNVKQFLSNQELIYTSPDLIECMALLKECMGNVRLLVLEVLDCQKDLIFNIPISNITDNYSVLNRIIERTEYRDIQDTAALLLSTIDSIKPWFANIHDDVVKEIDLCTVPDIDKDTDNQFLIVCEHLSEKIKNKDFHDGLVIRSILEVFEKHESYKNMIGKTGEKIVLIKCISDCLDILTQLVDEEESNKNVVKTDFESDEFKLINILNDLSGPIETCYRKLMHLCNDSSKCTDKGSVLKDLDSIEEQLEAINVATSKLDEKILKHENCVNNFSDTSVVSLSNDLVAKVISIQHNLENIESVHSVDMNKNIQYMNEVKKVLTSLIVDKVTPEDTTQFQKHTNTLLHHMEQYIEIIEIVEEISAVIKIDHLKKSADLVRELRENIQSETAHPVAGPEHNKKEQMQLVENLQNSLTTFQIDFDCEQELAPKINDNIRQQMIEVVSDLQNDLVALSSSYVVPENLQLLTSDIQRDSKCVTLANQENDSASSLKININKQDEQYTKNEDEKLNITDSTTHCDVPIGLATEEIESEALNITNISFDENQITEVKPDTDLINIKKQYPVKEDLEFSNSDKQEGKIIVTLDQEEKNNESPVTKIEIEQDVLKTDETESEFKDIKDNNSDENQMIHDIVLLDTISDDQIKENADYLKSSKQEDEKSISSVQHSKDIASLSTKIENEQNVGTNLVNEEETLNANNEFNVTDLGTRCEVSVILPTEEVETEVKVYNIISEICDENSTSELKPDVLDTKNQDQIKETSELMKSNNQEDQICLPLIHNEKDIANPVSEIEIEQIVVTDSKNEEEIFNVADEFKVADLETQCDDLVILKSEENICEVKVHSTTHDSNDETQILELKPDIDLLDIVNQDQIKETSELLKSSEQEDQICLPLIHNEKDIASPVSEIEIEQIVVTDSKIEEERFNVTDEFKVTDLETQCDDLVIMQSEENKSEVKVHSTTHDSNDETQILELKPDIDLLDIVNQDQIKETSELLKSNEQEDQICLPLIHNEKDIASPVSEIEIEQIVVTDSKIEEERFNVTDEFKVTDLETQCDDLVIMQSEENKSEVKVHSTTHDSNDETQILELKPDIDLLDIVNQDQIKETSELLKSNKQEDQICLPLIHNEKDIASPVSEIEIERNLVTDSKIEEERFNVADEFKVTDLEPQCDDLVILKSEENKSEVKVHSTAHDSNDETQILELKPDIDLLDIVNQDQIKESEQEAKVLLHESEIDETCLNLIGEMLPENSKLLENIPTSETITDTNNTRSKEVQEESSLADSKEICSLTDSAILYDSNTISMVSDGNVLNATEIMEENLACEGKENEKSNSRLELEILLQEVNETLRLSENYSEVQNTEELQDILEEVQTVILKLKCDIDGFTNDTLNEYIEDLECNVRSIQLQINENCLPELVKEACANLLTLATSINNIYNTQNTHKKQNIDGLGDCAKEAEQVIELLDNVSHLGGDKTIENIIGNLKSIKDTMNSLKSCFVVDTELLILRGIEVLEHLNSVEDKVFALEKELELIHGIDLILRDSIIAATHSIYGSISNMRSNLGSIQKKYMYDNYGHPLDNLLKSIKNVNQILIYDKKENWKQFVKSLRKVTKHFEDIKFYINFDKTARLPSDSAFTKIILGELRSTLSEVVLPNTKDIDIHLATLVEDAVKYVSVTLYKIEKQSTLEVREKIPMLKELSVKMYVISDTIKTLLHNFNENINQITSAELQNIENMSTKVEENYEKENYGDNMINIIKEEYVNSPLSIQNDDLLNNTTAEIFLNDTKDSNQQIDLHQSQQYSEKSDVETVYLPGTNIDQTETHKVSETFNLESESISGTKINDDVKKVDQLRRKDAENNDVIVNKHIENQCIENYTKSDVSENIQDEDLGVIKVYEENQVTLEENRKIHDVNTQAKSCIDNAANSNDNMISISEEIETYFDTSQIENKNVLDEKTGLQPTIKTISQEPYEKESQNQEITSEALKSGENHSDEESSILCDNTILTKKKENSVINDTNNIAPNIFVKDFIPDNTQSQLAAVETEKSEKQTVEFNQQQNVNIPLDKHNSSEEVSVIQTRLPDDFIHTDSRYQNQMEEESKAQRIDQISNRDIKSNVSIEVSDDLKTNLQTNANDIYLHEQDNLPKSKIIDKLDHSQPGTVLTFPDPDILTETFHTENPVEENMKTGNDTTQDKSGEIVTQQRNESKSLDDLQYTDDTVFDLSEDIESNKLLNRYSVTNIDQHSKEMSENVDSAIVAIKLKDKEIDLIVEESDVNDNDDSKITQSEFIKENINREMSKSDAGSKPTNTATTTKVENDNKNNLQELKINTEEDVLVQIMTDKVETDESYDKMAEMQIVKISENNLKELSEDNEMPTHFSEPLNSEKEIKLATEQDISFIPHKETLRADSSITTCQETKTSSIAKVVIEDTQIEECESIPSISRGREPKVTIELEEGPTQRPITEMIELIQNLKTKNENNIVSEKHHNTENFLIENKQSDENQKIQGNSTEKKLEKDYCKVDIETHQIYIDELQKAKVAIETINTEKSSNQNEIIKEVDESEDSQGEVMTNLKDVTNINEPITEVGEIKDDETVNANLNYLTLDEHRAYIDEGDIIKKQNSLISLTSDNILQDIISVDNNNKDTRIEETLLKQHIKDLKLESPSIVESNDELVKKITCDNFETLVRLSSEELPKETHDIIIDQRTIDKEKNTTRQDVENNNNELDRQILETIGNEQVPDCKLEKKEESPKSKRKKTFKGKDDKKREKESKKQIKNINLSQEESIDEELLDKKDKTEDKQSKKEIKADENKNIEDEQILIKQSVVQSDKSKDPQNALQHEQPSNEEITIEKEEHSENVMSQNKNDETSKQFEENQHLRQNSKEQIDKDAKHEGQCTQKIDIEKKESNFNDNDKKGTNSNIIISEKEQEKIHRIETDIRKQTKVQEDAPKQASLLADNMVILGLEEAENSNVADIDTSTYNNKVIEQSVEKSNYLISDKNIQKSCDSRSEKHIIENIDRNIEDVCAVGDVCADETLELDECLNQRNFSLINDSRLRETKNVSKEFQEHTMVNDYSSHGQSAYCLKDLQESGYEKVATESFNIQDNNLLNISNTQLGSTRKHKALKLHPSFIDRCELDFDKEFARPSGYTAKSFDTDYAPTEIKSGSKTPTIYRAQTLVHESQLKSSFLPYINQRMNMSEGRTEHKQMSSTTSDSRSTISEKRGSHPKDFKRKPVFSTYLTDRTAVESSRVKLTCSVLSSIDSQISWYKNGVLLDNKHKYRTKNVDGLITIEVLNAVPSDSGEYSCTVENENGSITTTANLKVYPGFEPSPIPPTFTRSIRDMYHLHENELVLECRIRGQPVPTITWFKDNRPIVLNERYQAHYLADGVCRLTIVSPTEDDSGKYTCKAENSMWSDEISHEVFHTNKENRYMKNIVTSENIRFNRQAAESRRPHFTNVLSDHKVVSGGTIGLQVEISGSPTRVEWLREGQSVTEIYRNAQTYIERGLYTLALSDVTEKESGLYTCRAWSTHGTVDMNASITVVQPNQFEGKPATIISRPVKDLLISIGEDLNISFRVQGEPKPKVFFMKGIRDITNSQRVCKMTSDDYVKFTLKRSVISDAGTYCVFAKNIYGCDRAFVTVVIRQRASSEHLVSDWTYPMDDLAISVVDRQFQSVPDGIPNEPSVVDGGNNWVSLAWPKPICQVKAPILAYKVESWLLGKDGGARWIELGITPRNCFDAFNLKHGAEYHFRVTPRNRYGWGESVQTSTPVRIGLDGDSPEFIEILPGQLKVLVGETASLCCSFKGDPTPEVVWMKNGHEVEEETERIIIQLNGTNSSLKIKDIKIEDEGRYSCEASNVHGRSSTYSRMAVITDRQIWAADAKLKRERSAGANGEYPPQFTMRLRDRRVQATYPVRLTCQVIGSPTPNVTWFKDGEEISLNRRRIASQDEYFYTLEIAPTILDDGGLYEAMARNGSGAISCRCNLVVDKGIRAYIAPEFCCGFEPLYRVCEGDELRISAVVEAYPSVGVTWYRDGVRLRPSRRAIMTLDRDGQIELALASVAARDAGVYTCTASNEVGRASTSGKVEVLKGEQTNETPKVPPIIVSPDLPYSKEPMFIKKPRSSEALEGDTVIIECEVIGDPKPEVYWLRDFLKPDYYRDASHFKRVGAGPAYRFEIPHAKFDYTGAYSIVARNIHGEAKAIISLQILAKDSACSDDTHNIRYGRVEVIPRFEKELTDMLCYDGDVIEFECRVSGNPEPDIRWFHYTEVLPECSDFETSYDLGIARLKIKQVTAEDEGTYTCEASNNLGKASSSACLVIYPPGEPNTLSQSLRRPPALFSASSTPRSTPRATPARSLSRTPGPDLRRLCSPSHEISPKFYTYPYNRVVEEGDSVTFRCAVRGLPPPWTTWDKDGIILTPTSRISIKEKDDMFRILEIEQVTVEDVGLYRITLENDYGRAEASARLEVISQTGKFHGSRSYSVSPRKCLPYRRRTPSLTRQD